MVFSLKVEYIALIINVILLFFSYEEGIWENLKKRSFLICVIISIASILVNIASVVFMGYFPYEMNMLLSSAYYLVVMLNVSYIAGFLVQLMTQHVPQCNCARIIYTAILIFFSLMILFIVLNFWTGCLFSISILFT